MLCKQFKKINIRFVFSSDNVHTKTSALVEEASKNILINQESYLGLTCVWWKQPSFWEAPQVAPFTEGSVIFTNTFQNWNRSLSLCTFGVGIRNNQEFLNSWISLWKTENGEVWYLEHQQEAHFATFFLGTVSLYFTLDCAYIIRKFGTAGVWFLRNFLRTANNNIMHTAP